MRYGKEKGAIADMEYILQTNQVSKTIGGKSLVSNIDLHVKKGEIYEGVKAFVFDSKSGGSIAFARLKYVATLGGGINKTDPLQIQVSAKVLAPEQGGYSWWPITTPEYTKGVL